MIVLCDVPLKNHSAKTHYPVLADYSSPEISGSFVMLALLENQYFLNRVGEF